MDIDYASPDTVEALNRCRRRSFFLLIALWTLLALAGSIYLILHALPGDLDPIRYMEMMDAGDYRGHLGLILWRILAGTFAGAALLTGAEFIWLARKIFDKRLPKNIRVLQVVLWIAAAFVVAAMILTPSIRT